MTSPVRVLIVEDTPADAKLIVQELRRMDRPIEHTRVDDAASMRAALQEGPWDAVLSDWSMPRFSALAALDLLKASGQDIPFIIVSGTIGEEAAADAMRSGARDYVIKERLARLVPALERELRERKERAARRCAEEALRESEARCRRILEATNEGFCLLDADARITFANARLTSMLGYEGAAMVGLEVSKIIDEGSRAASERTISDRRPGTSAAGERKLVRKDGGHVWARVESTPFFDPEGRYEGRFAKITDITERRRADAALRVSEARFRKLWESGIVLITVSDLLGNVRDVNDAGLRMLGYTREELLSGRVSWNDLTPPEWRAADAAASKQLHATGVASPWEKELIRKDGSRVPILAGAAMLDGEERIAIAVDLTERKQVETALRASEARFARLAESGIVGIAFADVLGKIHEANDACLQILGCSREDLDAGKVNWLVMTAPEWRGADDIATDQLKATGVAVPWEKELVRKDGSRVSVLLGVAMLEHTTDCIAFMADLTARKRTEEALRRSEEQFRQAQKMDAIGRLAGGVAHDFNNMLCVILTAAEFVIDALSPNDPMRADVEEIREAGMRAAALTRQLLLFSRQQVMEPSVVDLNVALVDMDKMLRRIVGEDIELVSLTTTAIGRVLVDKSSIEQVILNLVVNARDAMPTGGKLTIETANVVLDEAYASAHVGVKAGPHVMLAVSDTGVGMDRATQARIFEPFFTTKGPGQGTGLGLSTVFGIVHQSGGSVWVYSEPGRGTAFKVFLPRVAAEADSLRPTSPPATLRGSETVLLVEDEDQVRAAARGILTRSGYRVVEARNGGEALLICEQYPGTIHLLLSDVVMPQMSGPALAKRLASMRPEMRVLCMSGYTDDSIVRHGVLEAHFAFIQKPITPETLTRKVRDVLDSRAVAESAPR